MCHLSYDHTQEARLQSEMSSCAKGSLEVTEGMGFDLKRDLLLDRRCWVQQESNGCFAFACVFCLNFKHRVLLLFSAPNSIVIFFLVLIGANVVLAQWEWLFIPVVPWELPGGKARCSSISAEILRWMGWAPAPPRAAVLTPLGCTTRPNDPKPGWTAISEI